MKILILEFITSVGGVQTVYRNIMPYLVKKHEIYFLDPYENEFDKKIISDKNAKIVNMPIKSKSALGWRTSNKLKILIKYGWSYFKYLLKLIKFVKSEKIDLIYVSGKKEITFACIIKKL